MRPLKVNGFDLESDENHLLVMAISSREIESRTGSHGDVDVWHVAAHNIHDQKPALQLRSDRFLNDLPEK